MVDSPEETVRLLTTSPTLSKQYIRDQDDIEKELQAFIRSPSGWRKVFGRSGEDSGPEISDTSKEIVAIAAFAFTEFLGKRTDAERLTVALAVDSRPTGPEVATVIARVLLSAGCEVRYLGISPAPEIMAYVRRSGMSGFVYVSASHNPIGHNGLKFGLSDGGVIGGTDAAALNLAFNTLIRDSAGCRSVIEGAMSIDSTQLRELNERAPAWKREALGSYLDFTLEVATMSADRGRQGEAILAIRREARRRGIGVVADFNGSARAVSIDREVLAAFGAQLESINDRPGAIVHTIVPEGDALEPCRRELEATHSRDAGFLLGYVPDNDGDRGNIVYFDRRSGKAEILRAQEVFALACMAELAHLVYTGELTYTRGGKARQRHAVVVNGPTSLRIDAIAKAFDVQVFRSEVGEANVVSLARDSRESGFQVRIMGEGSNGGNITYPASVRDPLNTIIAFLRLLLLGSKADKPGLFEIWCTRAGLDFDPEAGIGEMLASLPPYATTDVNDERAIVDIQTTDHASLKEAYEEIFLAEWDANRTLLARELNVHTWEEINYEGMNEIHGFGKSYRSGRRRGGLKILFKDDLGKKVAFIWMRGSGTEPVFRVLADVAGADPQREQWLLSWHVSMIRRADAKVSEPISASG